MSTRPISLDRFPAVPPPRPGVTRSRWRALAAVVRCDFGRVVEGRWSAMVSRGGGFSEFLRFGFLDPTDVLNRPVELQASGLC